MPQTQNVTAQHLVGFIAPRGVSDARWASILTVALVAMKRLGRR